jgi:hypothetical protein
LKPRFHSPDTRRNANEPHHLLDQPKNCRLHFTLDQPQQDSAHIRTIASPLKIESELLRQ